TTTTTTTTTAPPVTKQPNGDANQDGDILLNDAVLILQYLGNPDVYTLSDEGLAAADVSNPGDGITNKDALAIQKYVLHLIPSLPEI
ncbi:MAG: dockerin type I repeat-containing protein, partial [Ruminococcus sp.]|nr:dockerin type I repeat-containing protein [Ruminococcus sp.]